MNTHILHLETATTNCSVALSKEGILVGFKEQNKTGFRTSDYLHLYVEEVMQKAGITFSTTLQPFPRLFQVLVKVLYTDSNFG